MTIPHLPGRFPQALDHESVYISHEDEAAANRRLPCVERSRGGRKTMKATVTIHVETLWTNRAELTVEAELDDPDSGTNEAVISMMFDAARLMADEARGENERALFSQSALNTRHRELDERDARLDERDKRLAAREATAAERDDRADERESSADTREREQMEREVRSQQQSYETDD